MHINFVQPSWFVHGILPVIYTEIYIVFIQYMHFYYSKKYTIKYTVKNKQPLQLPEIWCLKIMVKMFQVLQVLVLVHFTNYNNILSVIMLVYQSNYQNLICTLKCTDNHYNNTGGKIDSHPTDELELIVSVFPQNVQIFVYKRFIW